MAQLSQTMEINSNRAEPLAMIVNSPVTGSNYDDFRKIMLAMIMPQQVMIDVECSRDENEMLSGVEGLMAKMLFSTTPSFRSITPRSARATDVVIGRMLTRLGYTSVDQQHPLNVNTARGSGQVWLELETHDVYGLGWVNAETAGARNILDPLYGDISENVIYAGLDQYTDVQDYVDFNDVPRPPMYYL